MDRWHCWLTSALQFVYGEDGMDGTGVEFQHLPSLKLTDAEVEQKYRWRPDHVEFGQRVLEPEIIEEIKGSPQVRRLSGD